MFLKIGYVLESHQKTHIDAGPTYRINLVSISGGEPEHQGFLCFCSSLCEGLYYSRGAESFSTSFMMLLHCNHVEFLIIH